MFLTALLFCLPLKHLSDSLTFLLSLAVICSNASLLKGPLPARSNMAKVSPQFTAFTELITNWRHIRYLCVYFLSVPPG